MPTLTITERLKAIQRRLGVPPDGLLGPVTLTRIEALLDGAAPPAPPAPPADLPEANLVVSRTSVEAIVAFEVSSESAYRRKYERPIWPGAASGVTIGIGYDLGYNTPAQIEKDWGGRLPDADVARLVTVAGKTGAAAQQARAAVADVVVPFAAAKEVFYTATLPRYARDTRKAYPGVEKLPPDAQGALLSLVYNRGASLGPKDSRREMRAIRPLVEAQDLPGIAAQIRAMKRLWDKAKLPGLHTRRDREAELVAKADRAYRDDERVRV